MPYRAHFTLIFLSIQAQDFIEEKNRVGGALHPRGKFLSIQAQDFIEEM